MLDSVSAQFRRLKRRVGEDIEKYADDPESNGFVIYYLTDQGGEPLKSTQTQAARLALSDLEETDGYADLKATCESLSVELRLDEHFYSDDPATTTIYRVVVHGWS